MNMYFTREKLYGAVICILRKKKGLTIESMVLDGFPVGKSTYSRMECGEVPISLPVLAIISERLSTSPSIILTYCEQVEQRLLGRGLTLGPTTTDSIELEGKGLHSLISTML